MKSEISRRLTKTFLFFFVFIIPVIPLYSTPTGKIIILYGNSCAGKSTLAKKLQKELSGNFLIIKKSPLVNYKRKIYIESVTGKMPRNRREINEIMFTLPESQYKIVKHYHHVALNETIVFIKYLANQGANIIFDVCTNFPTFLERLEGYNVTAVLVYAPLPVLYNRYRERTKASPRNKLLELHKRANSLSIFCEQFKVTGDDTLNYIDTVSHRDVVESYPVNESNSLYPILQKNVMRTLKQFDLENKDEVKIVPKQKPDLVINTEKYSVQESAQIVKNYLKKKPIALRRSRFGLPTE